MLMHPVALVCVCQCVCP